MNSESELFYFTLNSFKFLRLIFFSNISGTFETLLNGPVLQDDDQLVTWVRKNIRKPSRKAYNLEFMLSGLDEEQAQEKPYSSSQDFILDTIIEIFGEVIEFSILRKI